MNRTFLLFTANSTSWLGFEFLLYFPITNGYETEVWRLSSVFWIFAGVLYLEFANAIAGKRRGFLSYLGIVTAIVGYIITGFTDNVFTGITVFEWGTVPVSNPIYHTVISANTAIFTIVGMVIMYRDARVSNDETQKRITRLLLFGTMVAAVIISYVNVVLPNFMHIQHIPRYGASSITVFLTVVFYAMVKYRFLAMSPHEVAEEIYEGVKVGILLLDAHGTIMRANREAVALLGEIPLGADGAQFFKEHDVSGEFTGREIRITINDDTRHLTLSASKVVHSGLSIGTILMVQDVTSQKNAEAVLRKSHDELEREVQLRTAQLRRAQRMETIGTLAGGIAHDFNNSLAAILGFSKAALMDLPEHNPIRQDLTEVILAANRGKDMVNQILTLVRKENKSDFKPVDMQSLLLETAKLLQVNTPDNILVKIDIQLDFPMVNGAPTQLSQVIMNLYTNACHAMERRKSGTLTLSLDNIEIIERQSVGTVVLSPGNYVRFRIADTGTGIRAEDLAYVFDPFFTTRARDEGTGLGLASAQVIVHNHDGDIAVESKEGKGTVFYIFLPVLVAGDERLSTPSARVSDFGATVAGGEILWVDDKPQILRMGKRMLSPLGYKVTTADGGESAMDIFQQDPQRFCLVITDYSMPEITGVELVERLRKLRPGLPVILLSGYGEAISQEELVAIEINAFLNKPVEAKDLGKTIHRILSDPSE
ncbi:MAG: response regulator [Deltaproteobacteria bacterium]|nr:response regulator [Deltaproteobacteria bacterium]